MKTKIIFFSISLRKGGAENQLTKLALSLKGNYKMEVEIFYFFKQNDFVQLLESKNISSQYYNIKTIPGFRNFLKSIKKNNPDLVISYMFGANILARLVKCLFKIPIITAVRNNEISKKYKILYRFTYYLDDATTFNSQFALDKFKKEKITKPNVSYFINNAIDIIENSAPSVPNDDRFTLVSMAHFRPQKDYRTLFHSIKLVKDAGFSVRLFVLGHIRNQTWPKELIHNLGLEQEIELVGFTNNTKEYFEKADVLVLSSLWEGTPNAVLEGMAHYKPIIASNVPGTQEVVENSKCGLLFQTRDQNNLKEVIVQMIQASDEERLQWGINGFNYILRNFKSEKIHEDWFKLISEVLEDKNT